MSAPLQEGSYVLIKIPKPTKVSLKWTGPSRVLKAIGDNFYEIQDVTQDKMSAEHRPSWCTDSVPSRCILSIAFNISSCDFLG